MRLQKVKISNFKGIEHLEITLDEGINLFIGNNGSGKTSLLDALSAIVNYGFLYRPEIFDVLLDNKVRTTTALIGDATADTVYHYPIEMEAEILLNNKLSSLKIVKEENTVGAELEDYSFCVAFNDYIKCNDKNHVMPLLCYQRVGRGATVGNRRIGEVSIATSHAERMDGYKDAFSEKFNIDSVQKWCLQMELTEFQKKRPIQEYQAFQNIIKSFMLKMDERADNPKVFYSSDQAALVYSDGNEIQPIYNLSAGYQSILCLIMELAYRSVLLNPSIENVAEKISGIVLIDEIEIHLHAKWQWKILNALHETFPKVQLIIASHSPMILSSVKDASLFLMKSPNEVVSLESAYGYSINDVLDLRLESADSPEEVKAYFTELEDLIDKEDKKGINSLLDKAKRQYGDKSEVFNRINDFASIYDFLEEN